MSANRETLKNQQLASAYEAEKLRGRRCKEPPQIPTLRGGGGTGTTVLNMGFNLWNSFAVLSYS